MSRKIKKYIIAYKVDMEKVESSDYARNHTFYGDNSILLKGNLLYHSAIFTPRILKKMGIKPNSKESKKILVKVGINPNQYVKSVRSGMGLVEKDLWSAGKPILLEKGYTTNNHNALSYYSENGKSLTMRKLNKLKF